MRTPLGTLAALSLCLPTAHLSAQVTSPGGFLATEGNGSAALFGADAQARYMVLDGERHGQATAIKELAYRLDDNRYTAEAAPGRSWSAVTIDYSPCEVSRNSNVYSAIPLSTPTRVFAGAVSWPSFTGIPATRPAAWGGPSGQLRFPLSRMVNDPGTRDMAFDFVFRGGTLANRSPWTRSVPYLLDSYRYTDATHAANLLHGSGGSTTGGCFDTGAAKSARSLALSTTHSATHPDLSLRETMSLGLYSYATPAAAPLVQALGLAGDRTGTVVPGVTCNRLHLDFGKPALLLFRQGGRGGYTATELGPVPYRAALVGTGLWFQSAFADSRTGALKLSNAVETSIAVQPRSPWHRYRRYVIYNTDLTAPDGTPFWDGLLDPIVRYGR